MSTPLCSGALIALKTSKLALVPVYVSIDAYVGEIWVIIWDNGKYGKVILLLNTYSSGKLISSAIGNA